MLAHPVIPSLAPPLLAATLVLLFTPAAWAVCTAGNPNPNLVEATPTADFDATATDGTVIHTKTGLMWKRCAEGQTWDNNNATCTGSASSLNWQSALAAAKNSTFAGHTDWRVPNIKELQSIVETCGGAPAINTAMFPAIPTANFWSASSDGPLPAVAWHLRFIDGDIGGGGKNNTDNVARLVRGGSHIDSIDLLFGTVMVSKTVTGMAATSVPAGTRFPITLTCGATVLNANATTAAPAIFSSVPVGSCTVTEGALPAIAGVTWGTPAFAPSATVTLTAGATTPVTVTNTASVTTYAITTVANPPAGGTVSCAPNPVDHGGTATCTAMANAGYTFANWSGDCTGATCALSNVTATRNIAANFTLNSYPITVAANPPAGGTASCTPNPVDHGDNSSCTATANAGYTFASWSGDCTGSGACALSNVTGAKSVAAAFTQNTYPITATPVPAAGGVVSCAPNPVNHGGTATCTATANAGHTFSGWSGDCTGTGACTLSNVTATKTVTAAFTLKTFTGPTATSTGNATATVTNGGDTCGFAPTPQFVAVSSVPVAPPAGYSFPHGLFDFALANCTPGGTVSLTITYPTALPAGTAYWKYGPTPGNPSHTWYEMPANIAGNTATFSITDGGLGDDDLIANGGIVDQGGPGAPGTADIPTLSEWAMLLLLSLLLGFSGWRLRRKGSF